MLQKTLKQYLWPIILFLLFELLKVFSGNKEAVEMYYSTSWYASFATYHRALFAWLTFSVGDVLYTIAICYLLVKIYFFGRALCSQEGRKLLKANWKASATKTFNIILVVFLLFNILWGLNYNRIGIAEQLNLTKEKYTLEDLKAINFLLVQKINENKLALLSKNENTITTNEMFLKTKMAYDSAAIKYPFLAYRNPSIKKSMFSMFCNYAKIYGYYNPFTAEANINVDVPAFTQPYTTCHEVAHQLGYAKEMEANFVGYFAAKSSGDAYFKYSTYTDLFSYANNTLYYADTSAAFACSKLLLPAVVKDFKERRKFNNAHGGPLEPFIRMIYGKFLEQNEQPLGILSYNEVTSFIIGYYKRFNDL
jgi:Protein of unknown function (DUF3810)